MAEEQFRAVELSDKPCEPLPDQAARSETKTFSSEAGGLRDAARELNERCAEAKPIIERHYQYTRDTHDHKAGDQLEPHFTITAQRRARELVDMPRGEAETIEFLAARELTQEVDLDRANEQAARTGQPVRPDLNLVFDEKKEWVMR